MCGLTVSTAIAQLWEMGLYIPPLPILSCETASEAYLIHGLV